VTEPELATDRDNYCYRHPKRQSFVLCQRCGRTICADCQTQAAVGVQCPECVRDGRNSVSKLPLRTQASRAFRPRAGAPIVTYSIIAICVVVFAFQQFGGNSLTNQLAFGGHVLTQPWRVLTSSVAHGSILHLLFNMYALYLMGSVLEPMLGRVRLILLYVLTALGGCVAVLWIAPGGLVIGASAAIFGMFGAFFIIVRKLGGNATQILIVIGINLVLGFIIPGISWEGHVGGLIVGVALGAIITRTRGRRMAPLQAILFSAVAVALVVAVVAGVARVPFLA
jgi:membrane associated rhomboid family serine protease